MNGQPPADEPAAMADGATTERMVAGEADPIDTGDRSQAELLLEIAASTEFFHTADETGFADVTVNGHRECWPIRSKGFQRWLARQFYALTKGAPNPTALNQALAVCQARAHFDGPAREVHVRVAGTDGRIYLDLVDDAWRAIEIGLDGWRLINNPPVRFRREPGMRALPVPTKGGSIDRLRPFLNVGSDVDLVLVVCWILAALCDKGPYPMLVLRGEQGTAKSSLCEIVRGLIDPNTTPLRALPRGERDLFIAASKGHVQAFDNASALQAWLSDALCRLATGGGFGTRRLHTDQDEVLFDGARPIILNGIEDVVTRPDLADRAMFLTLEPIPEERRRPEAELWAAFEAERPAILGALLDAVVEGLRRLPETRPPKLPRMADFALWATACETAFWPAGTFWSAYCGNRDEAVEEVIDADPIAATVLAMMAMRAEWTGTASDLLGALAEAAGERVAKSKTWPGSPQALAGRLRRVATFLRKVGIDVAFWREGRARTRTIHITTAPALPGPGRAGAPPSASSATMPKVNGSEGLAADSSQSVADAADGWADDTGLRTQISAAILAQVSRDGCLGTEAVFDHRAPENKYVDPRVLSSCRRVPWHCEWRFDRHSPPRQAECRGHGRVKKSFAVRT